MSRLLCEIAVGTHTTPLQWAQVLTHDPRMIATVLDVIAEHSRRTHGR